MSLPRLWTLVGVGSVIDLNRVVNITPIREKDSTMSFAIHMSGVEPIIINNAFTIADHDRKFRPFNNMREATLAAWAGTDASQLQLAFSQLAHIEELEPGEFVLRANIDDPLMTDLLRRHISVNKAHSAIDATQELDGNTVV